MLRMILGVLFFVLLGCTGGGRDLDDDDDTTIRSGEEVPIEDQKFYDARPSISADGSRLTFISGRQNSLRVYKFTVGDDKPSRLTGAEDGLQDEFEAVISPDGTLVGFIGSQNDSIDVHVKKFSGSGDLTSVADDDNAIESQLSFSSDGALITFVRRSRSDIGAKVYVAEVSTAGDVSNVTLISETEVDEDFPTFIPTSEAGVYKVMTVRRSTTGFGQEYWLRTLSLGGGVHVDQETKLENMRDRRRDVPFSAGLDNIYFSTKSDNTGEFANANWVPKGKEKTDETFAVQSVLAAYDLSGDSLEKIGKSLGVSILSVSASHVSDGVLVGLTQDVWSCKKDKFSYVTRLKVIDPAEEAVVSITPEYNSEKNFTGLAETICVDKDQEVDSSINAAVVNGNATPNDYSIAYVSLFSKGDNEVRLLTYDGESYSITDVSQNSD